MSTRHLGTELELKGRSGCSCDMRHRTCTCDGMDQNCWSESFPSAVNPDLWSFRITEQMKLSSESMSHMFLNNYSTKGEDTRGKYESAEASHVSMTSWHPDGIQQYWCQPAYWREHITSEQTVLIFLADYFHVFISVFLLLIRPVSLNCRNNSFFSTFLVQGFFWLKMGLWGRLCISLSMICPHCVWQ